PAVLSSITPIGRRRMIRDSFSRGRYPGGDIDRARARSPPMAPAAICPIGRGDVSTPRTIVKHPAVSRKIPATGPSLFAPRSGGRARRIRPARGPALGRTDFGDRLQETLTEDAKPGIRTEADPRYLHADRPTRGR